MKNIPEFPKRVVRPSQYVSPIASFVSAVLPNGKGLVMVLRLYADESTDDATGIFRMAGYLMTHKQWKALDARIGRALGPLKVVSHERWRLQEPPQNL